MIRRFAPALVVLSLVAALLAAHGRAASPEPQRLAEANADEAADAAGLSPLAVARSLERAYEELVLRVSPSVVTVTAHQKQGAAAPADAAAPAAATTSAGAWVRNASADDQLPGYSALRTCSGFVSGAAGEIVTCRSLLLKESGELADLVTVETKDGRHTICDVVASEPTLDLAVLQLSVFPEGLPPSFAVARFGDSTALRPGRQLLAAGDPEGPEQFFASGLLAAIPSRECYQEQLTATYLQAALVVHPEAYGGPLFDLDGQVVGMVVPRTRDVAVLGVGRPAGIEFALPSNILKTIYDVLVTRKSFRSPWLGIAIMSRVELRNELGADAFSALKKPGFGVWIENTFDPGPAHVAGIQARDFLVKLDGRPVVDPVTFQRMLYLAGIGAEVKLELFRDGETFERTIVVAERPAEAVTR